VMTTYQLGGVRELRIGIFGWRVVVAHSLTLSFRFKHRKRVNQFHFSIERPRRILFGESDLFLALKIEVGVAARARIDDGRKVSGKIIGVALVIQRKSKGDLQRDLRRPDGVTVSPELTVYRDLTTGGNGIPEGLAVASKSRSRRYCAGKQ
jgi:hypothetical protein